MAPNPPYFNRFDGYAEFLERFAEHGSRTIGVSDQIRDLFGYTSVPLSNPSSFHAHPVILMLVNQMQKLESREFNKHLVRNIIFPNHVSTNSPPSFSIDGLLDANVSLGGVALTIKAFYNTVQEYQHNMDSSKFNTMISFIDGYFDSNKSAFLAEYYRHTCNISPSETLVDQYEVLLRSDVYRTMKEGMWDSGTWYNSSLEIFGHFVKMKACGASDDRIAAQYTFLTTQEPIIPKSAIPYLSPSEWKSYSAWLPGGSLDWTDLHATNLDYSYETYPPASDYPGTWTIDLATEYAKATGYFVATPVSCFSGSTRVLLGNGLTTKPISEVEIGDEVATKDFLSGRDSKGKVAFVSRPKREGRSLYELNDHEGIQFTSTHPLIVRSPKSTSLAFIDQHLATSLNPTWEALAVETIDATLVHQSPSDAEELYDILLETDSDSVPNGPTCYIVVSQNEKHLEVASEAPIMQWYPLATTFFDAAVDILRSSGVQFLELFEDLMTINGPFKKYLKDAAPIAWNNLKGMSQPKKLSSSPITIKSMFRHENPNHAQMMATIVEKLIGRLRRSINDQIQMGWLNDNSGTPKPHIVIHHLQLLSNSAHDLVNIDDSLHIKIFQNDQNVADGQVAIEHEGVRILTVQKALPLDVKDFSKQLRIEVHNAKGGLRFYGQGIFEVGLASIVAMSGGSDREQAVMKVQMTNVDPVVAEAYQSSQKWSLEMQQQFATELGEVFIQQLSKIDREKARRMEEMEQFTVI